MTQTWCSTLRTSPPCARTVARRLRWQQRSSVSAPCSSRTRLPSPGPVPSPRTWHSLLKPPR
eukprot:215440-Rhodomonas_salina.1